MHRRDACATRTAEPSKSCMGKLPLYEKVKGVEGQAGRLPHEVG